MHAEITAIFVHDEKLFAPTGDIGRWADAVAREFTAASIFAAPLNTRSVKSRANADEPIGSLKAGISGSVTRTSTRRFRMEVSSSASYSTYVLFGTGRIYSKSARFPKGIGSLSGTFRPIGPGQGMYLPPGAGRGSMFKQSVSGQRANNFLEKGFEATSRAHSSLRSMSFSH